LLLIKDKSDSLLNLSNVKWPFAETLAFLGYPVMNAISPKNSNLSEEKKQKQREFAN